MKCPLFTAAEIAHEPEFKPAQNDCLKEECAWWDIDHKQCAIWLVGATLEGIGLMLNQLVDKMPHEEQFRK